MSDTNDPMELHGDLSFFGAELPETIRLVHDDTGETRTLTADPGGED